ncbi:hypothetical protein Aple_031330 [Acrocarpospora pleiomorpha]|uniref:Uncharacterized protein n=1 Tax=Acrocarpospora pleiomorpha TaxID=90975 RepID=A0A5M3XF58_9ACTN|nr:hypothetical protein Aple_031330 [Acrocarpospora pleiomorpha]
MNSNSSVSPRHNPAPSGKSDTASRDARCLSSDTSTPEPTGSPEASGLAERAPSVERPVLAGPPVLVERSWRNCCRALCCPTSPYAPPHAPPYVSLCASSWASSAERWGGT